MNRRRFLSSVSAAALLAALPLPVVMGRAAQAALHIYPWDAEWQRIVMERAADGQHLCGIM